MKRALICLLTIALIFSALPGASASFPDVADPGLSLQIDLLSSMGIFSGMPDGTFRPEATLDRASFCVLAVRLSSPETSPDNYLSYIVFPDVRAGHWALGWVNAARSLKLISGYPNGSFGPSDPITFGQAVTVLMKALGYTDELVGMNWPTSYITKAASIGLTEGVKLQANDKVSRADAVKMIYNMLFISPYDETDAFMTVLGVTGTEDAILLSLTALMPDGVTPAVRTSYGTYARTAAPSSELLGRKGLVLLNKKSELISFTPYEQSSAAVRLSSITNINIVGTDGKTYPIREDAPVYSPDSKDSRDFAGEDNKNPAWPSLRPGESVVIYYTQSGAVDYIYRASARGADGEIAVLSSALSSDPLGGVFGGRAKNAAIYKNGARCDQTDLCRWDVLSFDAVSNTLTVSDFKLSGIYENGAPNLTTPTSVTVMGLAFPLTPDASAKMKSYKIGDNLTFLFTPGGTIADVRPLSELKSQSVLLAQSATSVHLGTGERGVSGIALPFGGTIFTGSSSTPSYSGQLVTVSPGGDSKAAASPIQYEPSSAVLDMGARTLGQSKLSPYCKFYEKPNKSGFLVEISPDDIPDTVASGKVLHAGKDASGKITHIVLSVVTYDSYTFGVVSITRGGPQGFDQISVGDTKEKLSFVCENTFSGSLTSGEIGGITGRLGSTYTTYFSDYVVCNIYTGLSRYSFDGGYVTIGSKKIPIAEGVDVYIPSINDTVPIEEARIYTNSFEAYTDPLDCKVRFIIGR